MPPKPPIRIPVKPRIVPKPKINPPQPQPGPTPRSNAPPSRPPPLPQWYQNRTLRSSTRYVTWGANGVLVICAMIWVRDHYVEFQHVRGASMAPTLSPTAHETGREDWVVIRPYMERSSRKRREDDADKDNVYGVQRGDVVTFWKPHKPEEMGIKRVVAIEGDTVYPQRGYARDPDARKHRLPGMPDGLPDNDADAITADDEELGKVVVPYGHVWIEGDNWRKSLDSNDFGPISKGLIQGKAVWVWGNWFRFERVGDGRDKRDQDKRSRVVKGRSEIPALFLE